MRLHGSRRDDERWRRGAVARRRRRAHRPRRAAVPGPSCQPSPTIAPSRTSDGADHGVGRDAAPAVARRAPGPAACAVGLGRPHALAPVLAGGGGTHSAGARRAHAPPRRAVSSHPDFHGRSRNLTGSTPGWLPGGRGLSPPVGNLHPAPKTRLRVSQYRQAQTDGSRRWPRRAAEGLRRCGGRSRSDEPPSRLANCFISVATATASP